MSIQHSIEKICNPDQSKQDAQKFFGIEGYGFKMIALQRSGSELFTEDQAMGILRIWGSPNINKVQDTADRILTGLQVDIQCNHFSIINPVNREVLFFDVIAVK